MTAVTEAESGVQIGPEELAQRIAILRRFKTLLTQQRDRFRSYLDILDKQQSIIESGDTDTLLAHVEIEEKIVADIFSIQKVIDPLEEMYHMVISGGEHPEGADEVPSLKAALEDLKNEAVIRSSHNKELLSKRMVELRSEIKTLRNNPYAAGARRASFSGGTASIVDIQG
jgi:hypothetical protein